VVPAEPDPRAEALQARRQTAAPSTSASFSPPDVSGRLAVSDREATLRALSELVARLGGTEDRRLAGRDGPIVELTIPREVYVEFAFRLTQLGRWQPTRQPAELPARVRVVLTIQG